MFFVFVFSIFFGFFLIHTFYFTILFLHIICLQSHLGEAVDLFTHAGELNRGSIPFPDFIKLVVKDLVLVVTSVRDLLKDDLRRGAVLLRFGLRWTR